MECPGIARLYDAGVDASGVPYIAMEYVQGEPLMAWCDARGLDETARIQVFLQVLDAVAYAHARQVIHRDLKPSNILVTGKGEVRLLDFGMARLLQPKSGGASLTRVYGLALTPEYASPELLRGEPIDSRSDIYSLGVVLHELLTGARPRSPHGRRPAIPDDCEAPCGTLSLRRCSRIRASAIRTQRVLPLRCGRSPTGQRISAWRERRPPPPLGCRPRRAGVSADRAVGAGRYWNRPDALPLSSRRSRPLRCFHCGRSIRTTTRSASESPQPSSGASARPAK